MNNNKQFEAFFYLTAWVKMTYKIERAKRGQIQGDMEGQTCYFAQETKVDILSKTKRNQSFPTVGIFCQKISKSFFFFLKNLSSHESVLTWHGRLYRTTQKWVFSEAEIPQDFRLWCWVAFILEHYLKLIGHT